MTSRLSDHTETGRFSNPDQRESGGKKLMVIELCVFLKNSDHQKTYRKGEYTNKEQCLKTLAKINLWSAAGSPNKNNYNNNDEMKKMVMPSITIIIIIQITIIIMIIIIMIIMIITTIKIKLDMQSCHNDVCVQWRMCLSMVQTKELLSDYPERFVRSM